MMRARYEDGAAMAVGPDRIFAILVGSGPALGPTLTEILQHHSDGDGSLESEARARYGTEFKVSVLGVVFDDKFILPQGDYELGLPRGDMRHSEMFPNVGPPFERTLDDRHKELDAENLARHRIREIDGPSGYAPQFCRNLAVCEADLRLIVDSCDRDAYDDGMSYKGRAFTCADTEPIGRELDALVDGNPANHQRASAAALARVVVFVLNPEDGHAPTVVEWALARRATIVVCCAPTAPPSSSGVGAKVSRLLASADSGRELSEGAVAFAMGGHARLGARSRARELPAHLVRAIAWTASPPVALLVAPDSLGAVPPSEQAQHLLNAGRQHIRTRRIAGARAARATEPAAILARDAAALAKEATRRARLVALARARPADASFNLMAELVNVLADDDDPDAALAALVERASREVGPAHADAMVRGLCVHGIEPARVAHDCGAAREIPYDDCDSHLFTYQWCARFGAARVADALVRALDDEYVDLPSMRAHRTALHEAARCGEAAVARVLLDRGATVDLRDCDGRSALHDAARYGHADVADMLLAAGAAANAADKRGRTPMTFAVARDHVGIARALVAAGARSGAAPPAPPPRPACAKKLPADAEPSKDEASDALAALACAPLLIAAAHGSLAMLRVLIKAPGAGGFGADVDEKDKKRGTALHVAAKHGRAEIVAELLRRGGRVHGKGLALARVACASGSARCLRLVLGAGASLGIHDPDDDAKALETLSHKDGEKSRARQRRSQARDRSRADKRPERRRRA